MKSERTVTVTTWYLEQTSPADLRPAAEPGGDIRIVRAEVPSPEFSRYLYASVGGDIRWTDRLSMSYAQWQEVLARPGTETWVAYDRGTPAGYVELCAHDDGAVEIMYFGLIPAFRGGGSAATCSPTASGGPGTSPTAPPGGRRPSGSGCTPAARTAPTRWTTT